MSSMISTSSFWLRAASIVGLVFAAGHTRGAPWTPAPGAAAAGVIEAMETVHFSAMGSDATYWASTSGSASASRATSSRSRW